MHIPIAANTSQVVLWGVEIRGMATKRAGKGQIT